MAAKSKKPVKKAVSTKSKASAKPKGGLIASSKKRFSLSPKQWALAGVAGFIVLTGAVYFLVQNQEQTTADAASCVSKVYKQGSSSTCVKYIQQLVNASGAAGKISADGVFGSGTKAAVVKFQKAKKITADGIVGSGTWGKLCGVGGAADAKKSAGCGGSSSSKSWQVIKSSYIGKKLSKGDSKKDALPSNTQFNKGKTYRWCVFASGDGSFNYYGGSANASSIRVNNNQTKRFCSNTFKGNGGNSYGVGIHVRSGTIFFGGIVFEEYK